MTTYTAYFRTDGEYATHDFEADTPEQALALARQLHEDDRLGLMFQSYDDMPVNEIEISGPEGDELALWRDADLAPTVPASKLPAETVRSARSYSLRA